MAIAVNTTKQVVAGAGGSWLFTNTGASNVFLTFASGRASEVLDPGLSISLAPVEPVWASTSSGTSTLVVASYDVVHGVVSGGTP